MVPKSPRACCCTGKKYCAQQFRTMIPLVLLARRPENPSTQAAASAALRRSARKTVIRLFCTAMDVFWDQVRLNEKKRALIIPMKKRMRSNQSRWEYSLCRLGKEVLYH